MLYLSEFSNPTPTLWKTSDFFHNKNLHEKSPHNQGRAVATVEKFFLVWN